MQKLPALAELWQERVQGRGMVSQAQGVQLACENALFP